MTLQSCLTTASALGDSALGVVRRDSDDNSDAGDAALDWPVFVGMVKEFTLWPKLRSLEIDGTTCRIDAARLFAAIDVGQNLRGKIAKLVGMSALSSYVAGHGGISDGAVFDAKMPVFLALLFAALDESYGTPGFHAHPTGSDVAKAAITYLAKNRATIEVRAVSHPRASFGRLVSGN
jgi:hypothetical protein